MAQRELYSIPKDRTTRTGGECNMLAWVQANDPTYLQMVCRLSELRATPRTEQNQFVLGQIAELQSALSAAEDALWNALEAASTPDPETYLGAGAVTMEATAAMAMRVTVTVQRDDIYQGYEMVWPKQDVDDPQRINSTHFATIAEARTFLADHCDGSGWRRIAPGFYNCEVTA